MIYETRQVQLDDIDWIVESAKHTVEDIGDSTTFNEEQIRLIAQLVVSSKTGLVCLRQGERVGVLCAMKVPHHLNPLKTIMFSLFFFVLPKYRNSRAVLELLTAYKELCLTADEGTISLPVRLNISDESLGKQGWYPSEKQYTMRK